MSEITDKIQSVKEKQAEQAKLLAVLEMWEQVKVQGIDPDEVRAMTFDPDRLTRVQEATRRSRRLRERTDPYAMGNQPLMFNVAILRDDRRIMLDPMIERPDK